MKLTPRLKLLLIASLFALPMIASVTVYLFFPSQPSANYGELLLPPQVLSTDFRKPHGERWLLIATSDIEAMRQVRLAAATRRGSTWWWRRLGSSRKRASGWTSAISTSPTPTAT